MARSKKLALLALTLLLAYLLSAAGIYARLGLAAAEGIERGRMKNVAVVADSLTEPEPEAAQLPAETASPAPASADSAEDGGETEPLTAVMDSSAGEDILETTIQGGLSIKNETSYEVDVPALLKAGPPLALPAAQPQILIIHTHASEAYTQAGLDHYEAEDNKRTEDTTCNIVRVGDELTELLRSAVLEVLHDREIYDYPSYTGSYTRSGAAVEKYLQEYPGIAMVIDMHRDALGANGTVYKTMAEEDGVCASQVMLLVGSDASGLNHPGWRSNLALALYLQQAVGSRHPTLMRPVTLVKERYNQHLTPGSMIIEVGSSGNTLQEALAAIRLFADAAAPALLELVESGG